MANEQTKDKEAKSHILGLLLAAGLSEARDAEGTNDILIPPNTAEIDPMDMTDRLAILDAALKRESADETPDNKKASLLARELLNMPVNYQPPSLRTEYLNKGWDFVMNAIDVRRAEHMRLRDVGPDTMEVLRMRTKALHDHVNALAAGIILEEIAWIQTREDLTASLYEAKSSKKTEGVQEGLALEEKEMEVIDGGAERNGKTTDAKKSGKHASNIHRGSFEHEGYEYDYEYEYDYGKGAAYMDEDDDLVT